MEAYEEPTDGVADKNKPRNSSDSAESPIAVILDFWKDFDLEGVRTKLDEQGLKVADNQATSLKNRRKLAESTRDFRKASNQEKLKLCNSLLKAYQEEVDNLTKRATFGENAFLNIYLKLFEAPDPCPALVSALELASKVTEVEPENHKMKHELEEYRAEAAHLKNQQATIRGQEEHNRQLEQQMEEKVKEIVEIKQQTLAEENQKTLEVLKEMLGMLLQEQLWTAKESVSNKNGKTQSLEFRAQSEEVQAAKQLELNLLTNEVERPQAWLLGLKREKAINIEKKEKEFQERLTVKQVEQLCKQVEILQAVGYNSIEAEDWEVVTRGEDMTKLETYLLDKNRKMEHELTQLKLKLHEKTIASKASEARVEELATKVDEQQEVISKELLVKEQLKEEISTLLKKELLMKERGDSHELQNSTNVTEKSETNAFGVAFSSNAQISFASVPVCSTSPFIFASTSGSGSYPSFLGSTPSFGSGSIPAFGASITSTTSSNTPFGASNTSTTPAFGASVTSTTSSSSPAFGASSAPFGLTIFSRGLHISGGKKPDRKFIKAKHDIRRRK